MALVFEASIFIIRFVLCHRDRIESRSTNTKFLKVLHSFLLCHAFQNEFKSRYKENYENQNILSWSNDFLSSTHNLNPDPSIINNCLIRSIFVNNVLIFERETEANEELFLGEKKKKKGRRDEGRRNSQDNGAERLRKSGLTSSAVRGSR